MTAQERAEIHRKVEATEREIEAAEDEAAPHRQALSVLERRLTRLRAERDRLYQELFRP